MLTEYICNLELYQKLGWVYNWFKPRSSFRTGRVKADPLLHFFVREWFSDRREFVCSLFPKAILFYFYSYMAFV